MKIDGAVCLEYIRQFRGLRNEFDSTCEAHTCQRVKQQLLNLFDQAKAQQTDFISYLWAYRYKCGEALICGQKPDLSSAAKEAVRIPILAAFDALLKDAEQHLVRSVPGLVITQQPSSPKKPEPAKSAHNFTNDLELAQAEIKRLQLQLVALKRTDTEWKARYEKVERPLSPVQTSEGRLGQELSKLKSDYSELAATKKLEKEIALIDLQKSHDKRVADLQGESLAERQAWQGDREQLNSTLTAASLKVQTAEANLAQAQETYEKNTLRIQEVEAQLADMECMLYQREAELNRQWQAKLDKLQTDLDAARKQSLRIADALQKHKADSEQAQAEWERKQAIWEQEKEKFSEEQAQFYAAVTVSNSPAHPNNSETDSAVALHDETKLATDMKSEPDSKSEYDAAAIIDFLLQQAVTPGKEVVSE